MSRNGSGTYSLPSGNPVVTATTITSTWANTTLSDIATALTGSLAADGQTPATGNLNMNTNRIINVVDPTLSQDAATKVYVDTAITTSVAAVNSVITGSIQMWPTASAPTGYLLCAGAAVSRTTYAALFAIIGTTFGVGDGSTTFNVPNYSNRMPYGTTVGATGGSADAVVVSHTHTATVTDPGHTHGFNFIDGHSSGNLTTTNYIARSVVGSNGYALANSGSPAVNTVSIVSAVTGTSVANSTTGVSGTNANLPPYLGINFIIKV